MSCAKSWVRPASVIAAPPILITTVLPWNSRMYGSASRSVPTSRIRQPPHDPKTEQSKDAGSKACASKSRPEDAGMRRFAGSFADLLALEELDVVLRMQLDDRLLPLARVAGGVAAPLGLGLYGHRLN